MSTLAREPSATVIRAELDAVLHSDLFARAPSLAQFLNYVCTKSLNGESDQVKEYSIAVEALGRPENFDQKEDAIVRVEAHRLRKRLKQYYETAGAGHAVQIVIPPGQYVPRFIPAPDSGSSDTATLEPASECRDLAPIIEILPAAPSKARPGRRFWIVAICLAALAGALAVLAARRNNAVTGRPQDQGRSAVLAAPGEPVRIACGLNAANFVDVLGNVWLGDRYFAGGAAFSSPAERVLRTGDAGLFANRREGDFRYDIPLKAGVYELRLYFAERVFGSDNLGGGGETARLFHVFANGVPLAEHMDVISNAAGSNTADVRVFTGLRPAADGFLHLQFSSFKEKAFVNAIEVLPGLERAMLPVRILAGSSSYRDKRGNVWQGDRFSLGGQSILRSTPPANTADPDLYSAERFGNFTYAIPAATGRYTLNLHFAEAWFGPDKPVGGAEGSRIFDVHCNGIALLRNFDVYATAGGANRAVVRTFRGLTPNAQGKIILSFVPVVNYAVVNAIELIAEDE